MSKKGLITKEEMKFFTKFVLDKSNAKGLWKTVGGWFLPNAIDNIDDKIGEKVPEPWQSYIETFFTMLYDALQDKHINDEEREELITYCGTVIAAEINLPEEMDVSEADEVEQFILLIKYGVGAFRLALRKKK